jgi:hypothetical protein
MKHRWILVLGLGLTVAGLVTPTWAGSEHQVGAECTLKKDARVTNTWSDIRLVVRLIQASDTAALTKLSADNRVSFVAKDMTVVIEEVEGLHVEVRPKGEIATVWTVKIESYLDCRSAQQRASEPMAETPRLPVVDATPSNGDTTAKVGARCETVEGWVVAPSMQNLVRFHWLVQTREYLRMGDMLQREEILRTKPTIKVVVTGRTGILAKVAYPGVAGEAWVHAQALDCQAPGKKKGK